MPRDERESSSLINLVTRFAKNNGINHERLPRKKYKKDQ